MNFYNTQEINWRNASMTEKEEVKKIVDKYKQSIMQLLENGTIQEAKTVFKHVADESNRKQRELVGLED